MYQIVSDATLQALSKIDSPSICNAIEGFDFRPKNTGFMLPEIKDGFSGLPTLGRLRRHRRHLRQSSRGSQRCP